MRVLDAKNNVRIDAGIPGWMPERMSEYICRIYYQMVCQKRCQTSVSRWGSLDVKYVFDENLLINIANIIEQPIVLGPQSQYIHDETRIPDGTSY
jgi:hypothetical protein